MNTPEAMATASFSGRIAEALLGIVKCRKNG